MRSTALVAALVFTALTSGCGEESPSAGSAGEQPAAENSTAVASPAATAEDFGDWDTEAFADAAGTQLALLKDFLKGKAPDTSWDAATCDGLTEFKLQDLPTGSAFAVRRAESMDGEIRSLTDGLAKLRQRFESHPIDLAEIKIVHVDLAADPATTELYVHLAGGPLQINAVWNAAWNPGSPPALKSIETDSYEECERTAAGSLADSTGSVLAADVPNLEQLARGMDHWVARLEMLLGIEIGGWHGIAVADVNGDGLDDVFLPDGGGLPNRLFLQQPDGTVRDASLQSGLDFLDHTWGALFADFDNDGDQDAVLSMNRGVLILSNDGAGAFTVRQTMLLPAGTPYSLCTADYDQDGDLDLYICCYTGKGGERRHSFVARPMPYHDAENGGRNELFRNEGNFVFRNVTKAAGLDADNHKFSYAASWEDYDGDGDLDLYVANDFGRNHLYRNRLRESGEAAFEEVAAQADVQDIAAGMSVSWGDFDNDGNVDLYVGNMFSSAGNRIAFQERFKPGEDPETRALYRRHARGNSLFRNQGDGTFEDVSTPSGTTMGRWSWSSLFTDLDNDGWEDLLVANGFITQTNPADL